jgi:hypothetical protein
MPIHLTFCFRIEPDNQNWPVARFFVNDLELIKHSFNKQTDDITVDLTGIAGITQFSIVKEGGGSLLEITKIKLNQIEIPDYVIRENSKFCFNDQTHQGSLYFVPNGVWTWYMQCPIVTWILDQKIKHESQYNQDYNYPWSYSFGPDSVRQLSEQLYAVKNKVNSLL